MRFTKRIKIFFINVLRKEKKFHIIKLLLKVLSSIIE